MTLRTIARWDARTVLRDRWFISVSAAFAGLVIAAAAVALGSVDVLGVSAFGRVAATLVHLGMLFIPLLGLTVGAVWIAGERESGALVLLLSQPVERRTIFTGKYLGVAWGMAAAVALGFGAAGLLLALRAGSEHVVSFLWLVILSLLLALAMLATGFLISAGSPGRSRALGAALVVWLALVIISDLGVLGTALILRLPASVVLLLGSLNPVSAFRLAALVGITGGVDLTGPVGLYAADRLGLGGFVAALVLVLLGWTLAAYLIGRQRFLRAVEG